MRDNQKNISSKVNPWLYVSIVSLLIIAYLVGKAGGIVELLGLSKRESPTVVVSSVTPMPSPIPTIEPTQKIAPKIQQNSVKREVFVYPISGKSYNCDSAHISEIRSAGTALENTFNQYQKKIDDDVNSCPGSCNTEQNRQMDFCNSQPYDKACYDMVKTTFNKCFQSCRDIVKSDQELRDKMIAPFLQSISDLVNKYCN